MTHIENLLRRVNRLRDLLTDPHPSVGEWRLAFNAASESLLRFYDASQVPPASLFTSIPDATGHSGDDDYTICPECLSPDATVRYTPHDTHSLCANIWHFHGR